MNWIEVIKFVISALGFGSIFASIINRKLQKREKQKEEQFAEQCSKAKEQAEKLEIISVATKIQLRNIIYDRCNIVKKRGYIWLYELEELEETVVVYENLKGNGTAHKTYKDITTNYKVVTSPEEVELIKKNA